jgi:hypothetical protein
VKPLSGKRANGFRPRFTAKVRSRPVQKQAAPEAQPLACRLGRAVSNEGVPGVPLVVLDARAASLAGLMRQCVRRSPTSLRFSSGRGVAICVAEEGGAGCTASLSAFAEDASSGATAFVSWSKLPTSLSGIRDATSVPDESVAGRTISLAALAPGGVSFETLAVAFAEACSETSSLATSSVAVCAWTPLP